VFRGAGADRWFGSCLVRRARSKCTLLVYIDDATGQLLELWFVPDETFFAYCEASRHYFERCGKPIAFYSDKTASFGSINRAPWALQRSNPVRASHAGAGYPDHLRQHAQAKGRIERANQTLQDRLVKELRLRGISDLQTGNAYLPEFREDFNRRFAVLPAATMTPPPLLKSENLDLILTHQESLPSQEPDRAVQAAYLSNPIRPPRLRMRNAQVTICENAQGEVTILYTNQPLPYTLFHKPTARRKWSTPRPWIANSTPQAPACQPPLAHLCRRLNGNHPGAPSNGAD